MPVVGNVLDDAPTGDDVREDRPPESLLLLDLLREAHGPAEEGVGQKPLHVQNQLHLHGQPLEHGLLLDGLDVVNCQTHQQVHDDDGHDDQEDQEEDDGGGGEGNLDALHAFIVEDVFVLEFPDHHDRRLHEGVAHVVESGLKEKERKFFNQILISYTSLCFLIRRRFNNIPELLSFSVTWYYLINEENVETESKGHNEYQEDDRELEEGLEDVEKHDDVDPEERELADVTE